MSPAERAKPETVTHPFAPIADGSCRILLLGTMPSPKSRERNFYYGHPRNRFWPVLAAVLGEALPETDEGKRRMALRHHIAVWDVLASCEIHGADDSTIRRPVPNQMSVIFDRASIQAVFTTGTRAYELYRQYCFPATRRKAVCLPSTSPANCRMSMEQLIESYRQITPYLDLEEK